MFGLQAAIHIDQRGIIWLNLSQLMKLVGKTKKQVTLRAFSLGLQHICRLLELERCSSWYPTRFRTVPGPR